MCRHDGCTANEFWKAWDKAFEKFRKMSCTFQSIQ